MEKKDELIEKTSRPVLIDILKTMREAVIIVGEDTGIIASNQMAYDAFARKNGALENKRLSEVIRDLAIHEAFRQALEKGESSEVKFEFSFNEKRFFFGPDCAFELRKQPPCDRNFLRNHPA